jgi:HEAT repeat protein
MSPIRYFCMSCWSEIPPDTRRCPSCGRSTSKRLPYRQALERALRSPEEFTARRAAYLLGLLADPGSIPPRARALQEGDPYVAAEAALALARINSPEARALVKNAARHRYVTVRAALTGSRRAPARPTKD